MNRRSRRDEESSRFHPHPQANHRRPADFSALISIGVTPRECEVLGWVADGKRDADIARILGIAPKTVGKHIEHVLAKLHAENRTAAASIARELVTRLQPASGPGRQSQPVLVQPESFKRI